MNKNLQNGFILGATLQGKTEAFEPQGEINITANGEYDVTEYATAKVNIQGKEFKASVGTLSECVAIFAFTPTATVEITE